MQFTNSLLTLLLGDPEGYHIRLGQDIPAPLNGDATIKAVLILAKDGDDYGYIALRDMGANNLGWITGFVIGGVNLNADGFMSFDSDTTSPVQIDVNRIMRINGSGLVINSAVITMNAGTDVVFTTDDTDHADQSGNIAAGWATTGGYLTAKRKGNVVVVRWNLIRTGAALAANVVSNIVSVLDAKYRCENDHDYTGAGGNISTGTYGRTGVFASGTVSLLGHAGFATNQRSAGCIAYLVDT